MSNQQPKPTFDVNAIMTNAHDGYRQAQADKAYAEQLERMLKDSQQANLRLRQRLLATEAELADTQAQRDNDRQQFVKTLMATVVIMTVLFIVAVSF